MGTIQNTNSTWDMKLLVVLAFLIYVSVALPTSNECERKTEVLSNALVNLAKKNIQVRDDCSTCINDILQAVTDCVSFEDPALIKCVQDIIGIGSDCYPCICEL